MQNDAFNEPTPMPIEYQVEGSSVDTEHGLMSI